jgi:hypothetical protein
MRPANDNLDPYRFMPPKPRWGWLWALLAFSVPVMLAISLVRLWIGMDLMRAASFTRAFLVVLTDGDVYALC